MSLSEIYPAGGPYMNVISLLALVMIVVTVWKLVQIISKKQFDFKLLDLILLAGSVSAAVGILSQIIGIVQALEAIRAAADVSPQIVMGGAIVSFYAPIYGFIVFVISMVIYAILKEIVKARKPE
ncbi:MAG TPA: MotA/TolQ/ExbB proton channel family protein [Draconibacterium sp.]|nr:MotA/TolQ/ExbB proton channel family protein [Draconibacterium sp.]